MAVNTVKVSNISSKATTKEIEEFFCFSGRIESTILTSDGDETQTAYVRFADQDSVRVALLLSGSVILDREVTISPFSNEAAAEPPTLEPEASSREAEGNISVQTRPTAINRAQEIVRSMLSRGFALSKDTMRRAKSLDESSKKAVEGDALKVMASNSLDRQKSEEIEMHDDPDIANKAANPNSGKDRISDNVNDNVCDNEVTVMEDSNNKSTSGGGDDDEQRSQQSFQGDEHGKQGSNNVRIGMQRYYKHVCAMNEKLQLGQRTLSALATAQQGVVHAGSAVANNKFVSAGGVWVSGALSRVTTRNPNPSPHAGHDAGSSSPASHHEQVQLTEMTTFSGHKTNQI